METVLIRADLLVYQAATATPVVSTALGSTGTGGLVQSLVPTPGNVDWNSTTTVSYETPQATYSTASQLVASGMIKVCVHQVIVSDI